LGDARILVVDDERFFREAIRDALAPAGFAVELAATGQEALDKLADPALGVVVLDLQLPDLHGLEVFRRATRLRPDVVFGALERGFARGHLEFAADGRPHAEIGLLRAQHEQLLPGAILDEDQNADFVGQNGGHANLSVTFAGSPAPVKSASCSMTGIVSESHSRL
jgi:CheY-like chemotaxis protein